MTEQNLAIAKALAKNEPMDGITSNYRSAHAHWVRTRISIADALKLKGDDFIEFIDATDRTYWGEEIYKH